MIKFLGAVSLAAAVAMVRMAQPAVAADAVADFYKGKQITMLIGSDVGGGYDTYARVVAHYLGNHIPGKPAMIAQNMPGAGSLQMTNSVANAMAKDGTVIGAPQNSIAFEPLFHLLSPGGANAKFDGTKLNWIGSAEQGVYLAVFWHTAGIKTIDDLRKKEVLVGASSLNTDEAVLANVLNNVFGTKLKLVLGYKGNAAIMHAMEQEEVAGVTATTYSSLAVKQPTWLKEGKITIPIQMALNPQPELKDVPFALDLVTNDDDRRVLEVVFTKYKMSRPYFFAQGVPKDRVAAVRKAFLELFGDPAFISEAAKRELIPDAVSGEDVQKLIEHIYATPAPLMARVRTIIGGQ